MSFYDRFKQLILLTNNSLIGSAASYFLTIYLANVLGAEKFGLYSYILTISAMCTLVINWSADQSAPSYVNKGLSKGDLFSIILTSRLALFLIAMISILLFLNISLKFFIAVMLTTIPVFNLSFYYEITGKNKLYSFIFLFERLLYVGVVVIALNFGFNKITHIILIYGLIVLASLLMQYFVFGEGKLLSIKMQSTKVVFSFLRNNFTLILISLSAFVYGGISKFFVEDKLGLEALGVFSSGMQLTVLATIFQAQVERIWRLPIYKAISDFDIDSLKKNIKYYFYYTTIPLFLFSTLLFFTSDIIVKILFTSEYESLIHILPFISILFITININSLLTILFYGLSKSNEFLIASLTISAVLFCCFIFLPSTSSLLSFILCIISCQFILIIYSSIRMRSLIRSLV